MFARSKSARCYAIENRSKLIWSPEVYDVLERLEDCIQRMRVTVRQKGSMSEADDDLMADFASGG